MGVTLSFSGSRSMHVSSFFTASDLSQELLSAASRSYRVTRLSAKETYLFSIRPVFGDTEGPETTLLGQTGMKAGDLRCSFI